MLETDGYFFSKVKWGKGQILNSGCKLWKVLAANIKHFLQLLENLSLKETTVVIDQYEAMIP